MKCIIIGLGTYGKVLAVEFTVPITMPVVWNV